MAELTPEQKQASLMLAAMAAAHRGAQLATVPGTPAENAAVSAANGAMADCLGDCQSVVAQATGGWVCLPYYGEGNGRRLYDLDSGTWGASC